MINNEFVIEGFERYKSDDGKCLYAIKITDGNRSKEEKEYIKFMSDYFDDCIKKGIEPKIECHETVDENYYILHDYIEWFNHRKDNLFLST